MIIIKDGEIKAQEGVLNSTSQVLALKGNELQPLQTSISFISIFVSLRE